MPDIKEAIAALEKAIEEYFSITEEPKVLAAFMNLRAIAAEREQPDLRPGLEAAAIIQCRLCGRANWPELRHGAWHHLGPGEIGLCYAPKIHEAIRALPAPKVEPQKAGAQ